MVTLNVLVEERHDARVGFDAVLPPGDAVALVVEDERLDRDVLRRLGRDLFGLPHRDPGVVRAVEDEKRGADLVRVVEKTELLNGIVHGVAE